MASSQGFADFVCEQLEGMGRVVAKRMFGGFGIYQDSLMFALIAEDELYLKADDSNRDELFQLGGRLFCPFEDKGGKTKLPYVSVSIDIVEDADALLPLARKSLDVALRAQTKKPKRQAKTKQGAGRKSA